MGEMIRGKKNIRPMIMMIPYLCAISEKTNLPRTGRNAKIILEPSRGGIGIKLNIAKEIFRRTMNSNIGKRDPSCKNLSAVPKMSAINRFEIGPANATSGSAIFRCLKLYGLYDTGFAHPIMNGEPMINKNRGSNTDPYQSRCLIGFRVSLPSYCAVLSPKAKAIVPCEISWIMTERIKMTI